MAAPEIKLIACSNTYIRSMSFENKGDVEVGHSHPYDHATLLSHGTVLYEVLDGFDGNTVEQKEFKAPTMIFVPKDKFHRLTALEDKTVCACIHALRTIKDEIIDPDFLIEPLNGKRHGDIRNLIDEKIGIKKTPNNETKKYLIRFNKSRGQEGRGSETHVWRVFENGVEHLAKDIMINVPSWGEIDGLDWNIACKGVMQKVHEADLIIINPEK